MSVYEFDFNPADWKIQRFGAYDLEWLEYVTKCRNGDQVEYFDLIIGGIANDKVILTIDRYFTGEITALQALGELKYERPNNQYCIRSQEMIDKCLKHIESKCL